MPPGDSEVSRIRTFSLRLSLTRQQYNTAIVSLCIASLSSKANIIIADSNFFESAKPQAIMSGVH